MHRMPNFFDWIIPDQLGACVHPGMVQGLVSDLQARRIGLVVNLDQRPDPPKLFEVPNLQLPVPDFQPPTDQQLDRGVAAIAEALAQGTRVAVHCGAGLGRTGTLLAVYLVWEGSTPEQAIARIRAARPGVDRNTRPGSHGAALRAAPPSGPTRLRLSAMLDSLDGLGAEIVECRRCPLAW